MPEAPVVCRGAAGGALRRVLPGPEAEAWLSPSERDVFAALRGPRRREEWLAGRLLAKRTIVSHLRALPTGPVVVRPPEIEIHSTDGLGRPARPRVTLRGRPQPWALSIAHADGTLLVAVAFAPGCAVGVDVAPAALGGWGFAQVWLTPFERRWLRRVEDPRLLSALWAIKEAVYKAVNAGERFLPAGIEVRPRSGGGYTYHREGTEEARAHRISVATSPYQTAAIVTVAPAGPGASP